MALERTKFDDMAESLKEGVQVVGAPQLFETPDAVIRRIMELADITASMSILEPSAGTGRLVRAAFERTGYRVDCVEQNVELAQLLRGKGYVVTQADFLECEPAGLGLVDRIVMNPPFKDAADIKHVQQAREFLAPGGPRGRRRPWPSPDEGAHG